MTVWIVRVATSIIIAVMAVSMVRRESKGWGAAAVSGLINGLLIGTLICLAAFGYIDTPLSIVSVSLWAIYLVYDFFKTLRREQAAKNVEVTNG